MTIAGWSVRAAAEAPDWETATSAEAEVVEAQAAAEASDPRTTAGDRLHRTALEAHAAYRAALEELLVATPAIGPGERESVIDGFLTSRELTGVLHLRLGEYAAAEFAFDAVLAHPGIGERPMLWEITVERRAEAMARVAAGAVSTVVGALSETLRLRETEPELGPNGSDRRIAAWAIPTAGALAAGGASALLFLLAEESRGDALALLESGEDGSLSGYQDLRTKTRRRNGMAWACAGLSAVAAGVAVFEGVRGRRRTTVVAAPNRFAIRLDW